MAPTQAKQTECVLSAPKLINLGASTSASVQQFYKEINDNEVMHYTEIMPKITDYSQNYPLEVIIIIVFIII